MPLSRLTVLPALLALCLAASPATRLAAHPDGNRLTYLDGSDPYYVSRTFPKLTAAQWVGEEGVDAAVILAVDDMRDPAKYEGVLRPALDRLKKIDGRAPVSIMTCNVDPADPRLQAFLKEGLSLEVHTIDHPCPILAGGDFAKAKSTYDRCVDLMNEIPGNRPVAFRTPCCDSKNTPSPRLWAEVFNSRTDNGRFLTIDSSVFNVTTPNDPDLPRNLVLDDQGRERFRRYLPFPSFVNTIEDYPYPYVIGKLCWQFPCVVPSDWESFNIQGKANPRLLDDWKAALDATVIKGGTFTLVFHPYGWSSPQQVADLVDYADTKYGKRVKFLTFREAQDRLDENLLAGQPLRDKNGDDNGVRLLDLNNDGYLDVVIGNENVKQTRIWIPDARTWAVVGFPGRLALQDQRGGHLTENVRFGLLRGGRVHVIGATAAPGAWYFNGERWTPDAGMDHNLPFTVGTAGSDDGVRLRDVDGDGNCEVLASGTRQSAVYRWDDDKADWVKLPFGLPEGVSIVDDRRTDDGLRFVDVDGDGLDDVLYSNGYRYSLHLWDSMETGWSRKVLAGKAGDKDALPPVVRKARTNNGAWFHSGSMWVQNEDTAGLADHVVRVPFNAMLAGVEPDRPRDVAAALKSFRVRPGFQIDCPASEPLVQDPIAFAWGADGRLWVVEMGDYPLGEDGKGKPAGVVRFLEDTDGDGVYDKSTVFLDNLPFPTGVTPWRNGVLVLCAPDIFYAEDTDGDGKADKREVLFTGFKQGNQQHRVNGLVWGLDNWLYGANGDSGGEVRSAKTGKVVGVGGRDFRLRPDTGEFEPVTGTTQYGRCRDDWGNWFGCNNSNPMWHYVLDEQYLRRNPNLTPPPTRVNVPEVPGASPVYPASRTLPRFNDLWAANHFTSANSVIVYRDDLFGPAFAGNSFVSEPVHNLVHREVMEPKGVTFTSRRADDEKTSEFLASTDNWFRPTMLQTGPDGALWVADMYRQVIEHPQWIPREEQKKYDLRAGHEIGRLYRVYPVGAKPRPIPRLDKLDAAGLVAALDSPSGWQRDTAQRLLFERQDKAAVPPLEKLAAESKRPEARMQALCALDAFGAVRAEVVAKALKDMHPGVRRHAVRLYRPALDEFRHEPGSRLAALINDPDPGVRLQVACTLGEWDEMSSNVLAGLLARNADDPYIRAAGLSSLNAKNIGGVLADVATLTSSPPSQGLLTDLLRQAAAMGERDTVGELLTRAAKPGSGGRFAADQFATVAAVLDAFEAGPDTSAAVLTKAAALFDAARALAADDKVPDADRVAAVGLLGRDPDRRDDDAKKLAGLLTPRTPDVIQSAAVSALSKAKAADTPGLLLAGWKGHSPAVRAAALDVLLARPRWAAAVLDAVEQKTVLAADVDAARRQKLLKSPDKAVRDRAEKLLADVVNPDRQKVIDAFSSAAALEGDATRGAAVFAKACATCHQFAGVGHAVGPDLVSVGDKSPEGLLVSILDPNRAVEPRFVGYLAETKEGEAITGVLSAEAGNSLTLLGADGNARQVLRTDLKSLRSTGLSLMPEGLEAGLKPQDLADLIAHVRTAGGPAGPARTFEGNRPEAVMPDGKGALKLTPGTAEISGGNIMLEKQYGNLGWWRGEDDRAVWTVQPARAGKYAVWLDYACDDGSAGNAFLLQVGGRRLTGKVEGTGNWDTYRRVKAGAIELGAGRQRITFRSDGKIKGALIDLRAVELVPEANP